jgi:hypothetical protein
VLDDWSSTSRVEIYSYSTIYNNKFQDSMKARRYFQAPTFLTSLKGRDSRVTHLLSNRKVSH